MKNGLIIYLSDFSEIGSGYQRIGQNVCRSLAEDFWYDVVALGLNYKRGEYDAPFRIVACPSLQHVPNIVNQIISSGVTVSALVVALDIPLQKMLIEQSTGMLPYVGLFPLEAPPLSLSWAAALRAMDVRLVMSKFAKDALAAQGVDSVFVPIGIDDVEQWMPPTSDEKKKYRRALGIGDEFTVLTVADNQERKNLSVAMEIFSMLSVNVGGYDKAGYATDITSVRPTKWVVVTRTQSPVGYDLVDLAMRFGVLDRVDFVERGISADELRMYYAAADAFLLTSKAEGLAIPQMEAMAMKLPVIVTGETAMAEHVIESGCGYAVKVDYELIDPFGNGMRYMIDKADAAMMLIRLFHRDFAPGVFDNELERGRQYVLRRRWVDVAGAIDAGIKGVRRG